MTIPAQNITIRDPGLGTVPEAIQTFLLMGTSDLGANNVLFSFTNKPDAIDTLGQGPLTEDVCRDLDIAGGPVLAMKINASVAGAAGAVTKTPVAGGSGTGTVTVAGAAKDAYEAIVKIVTTGTVATGEFQYSLDGEDANGDGRTDSEVLLIPASGTFIIPETGLTLTFVPGGGPVFFEEGDVHKFDATAPYYSTVDLAAAVAALLLDPTEFAVIHLVGDPASSSDGATIFAALAVHLTSLFNQNRFVGAFMDAGSLQDDRAQTISDHASSQSSRISPVYGFCDVASSKPFAGWGTPRRSILTVVGSRAANEVISTDLARFASGALQGVVAISDDEFRSPLLDAQKFTTLRTWQGADGFYITNANLKSAPGSDFIFWQHRRVMDVACDTTFKAQQPFIATGVRTNENGSINDNDARQFEQKVRSALRANLIDPANAEGNPGHISDFGYNIDRENDVLTTGTMLSKVAIRPLGYPKTLETEIGFSKAV